MALRSVLRKMPALGLSSPPMGPLMEPVRALSPAAGSRLMSGGSRIDQINKSIEEYRRESESSASKFYEVVRQDHEKVMKIFAKIDRASSALLYACPVAIAVMLIPYFK